ncbi:MAG: polymerase [Planctomycetaceae bacterium]|nr:polymerase [Planctomycetaceae bacterium]
MFLLVTTTLIIRPSELVKELAQLPIYEGLILGAVALSYREIQQHFQPNALRQQPITMCAALLIIAVFLSHMTHFYLYGVKSATVDYIKTLIFYGLLVAVVDTPLRIRILLFVVAVTSTIMVGMSVLDYYEVIDYEFITHITDRHGKAATGADILEKRMRGTGVFQDPNDISLLIVAAGVISLYFLTDKTLGFARIFWLFPLYVLGTGLLCTRSRGGLLAAAAAGGCMILTRYGRKVAISAAVCGVALLPLMAGRMGSISLSSGTGHERLLLWREGFQAIKSPYILFGIGYGMYGEYAGLVAHNSFVHAFVELGLFGGTLFFGMFFFTIYSMYRIMKLPDWLGHPELNRMRPYVVGILGGWSIGLLSLSRCYVPPTFLIIGIQAAFLNYVSFTLRPMQPLLYWDKRLFWILTIASFGLWWFLYFFILFFAR